jgi:hypothetical protein
MAPVGDQQRRRLFQLGVQIRADAHAELGHARGKPPGVVEASERSRQAREVSTQEKTRGGAGRAEEGRLKAGVRREKRGGNPEFLRGVERSIDMRCSVLGVLRR